MVKFVAKEMSKSCRFCFSIPTDPLLSPHKSPAEKGRVPPTSLPRLRHPPWNRLRSSCVVVRVDDLDVHQVGAEQSLEMDMSVLKKNFSLVFA